MRQQFFLIVRNYDDITIPLKIFLQIKDAIAWGRDYATKLVLNGDFNSSISLYSQEISDADTLHWVRNIEHKNTKEVVDKYGADFDIDVHRYYKSFETNM